MGESSSNTVGRIYLQTTCPMSNWVHVLMEAKFAGASYILIIIGLASAAVSRKQLPHWEIKCPSDIRLVLIM